MKFARLWFFAVVITTGCALQSPAPPVSAAMTARAGQPADVLEHGRRIYTTRCGTCHALDPVRKHDAAQWRGIIADMADESELTAQEQADVLAYVLAARAEPPRGGQ